MVSSMRLNRPPSSASSPLRARLQGEQRVRRAAVPLWRRKPHSGKCRAFWLEKGVSIDKIGSGAH
jgi:hypothetical protein